MARRNRPMVDTFPDPTTLTTDAIRREVKELVAEQERSILSLRELLLAKIEAEVALTAERFITSERLRLEQKSDTKAAVDAALTAQKEAVKEQTIASERAIAKSEAATTKQLEQQQVTFQTVSDALRRSIDEVKERSVEENRAMRTSVSEVATSANGIVQQKVGAKEDRTSLYATIAVMASIAIALVAVIGFLLTKLP